MTIKQLNERRRALLGELDKANETRTAEIRSELERIALQVETLRAAENDDATEQRAADERAARDPQPAPQGGGNADDVFRMAFQGNNQPPIPEQRNADSFDSNEYRTAFMQFCQNGTALPQNFRSLIAKRTNQVTNTGDVGAVIPTTITNEIIKKLESFGNIYAKVTKTNIQGGVAIPILSLKPVATWIGETTASDSQKLSANDKLTFSYFGLECKIAQSLLANVVTLESFQSLFVPLATAAIIKALEIAIFNGSGTNCALGITKDTRVPAANKIAMTAAEFKTWEGWKKKVFAKMKKSYRNGSFFMAQGTFDGYIDGMVDTTGQPIGRVNYGIEGEEKMRFGGKTVETVEDEIIANYEDAEAGNIVAVFVDLKDYTLNTNLEMVVIKWVDNDTNEIKNKVIMIVDGKLVDPNGVLIITKGTASA